MNGRRFRLTPCIRPPLARYQSMTLSSSDRSACLSDMFFDIWCLIFDLAMVKQKTDIKPWYLISAKKTNQKTKWREGTRHNMKNPQKYLISLFKYWWFFWYLVLDIWFGDGEIKNRNQALIFDLSRKNESKKIKWGKGIRLSGKFVQLYFNCVLETFSFYHRVEHAFLLWFTSFGVIASFPSYGKINVHSYVSPCFRKCQILSIEQ